MSGSRATAVEERPLSESVLDVRSSQFLVRTSKFLKRLSDFRGRKSYESSDTNSAYERTSRSVDLARKSFMSQHVLDMNARTDRDADSDNSSQHDPPHIASKADAILLQPPSPPNSLSSPPTSHVPPAGRAAESGTRETAAGERPNDSSLPQSDGESSTRNTPDSLPRSSNPPRRSMTTDAGPSTVPGLPMALSEFGSLSLPSRNMTLPNGSMSAPMNNEEFGQRPPMPPSSGSGGMSSRRTLAPRLATLPPPMMARYNAQGSARLTPSIVARQPPMPILHLPTLPPPTPVTQRPARPRVPLRSVPALPMQGPGDLTHDSSDHENADLGDSDDDDMEEEADGDGEGEGMSDEENSGEVLSSPDTSPDSANPPSPILPRMDTGRRLSVTFADAIRQNDGMGPAPAYAAPRVDGYRTPRHGLGITSDYFSSFISSEEQSPSRTPRPSDFTFSPSSKPSGPVTRTVPMPSTPTSERPALYRHASRSMVDISFSRKEKSSFGSPAIHTENIVSPGSPQNPSQEHSLIEEVPRDPLMPRIPDFTPKPPSLRRQHSMPTFNAASDPPPYPTFHPRHFSVQPRDEEGCERLPPYTNDIHLVAIMPRKVEFSQPGVQAKDRKWRRTLCVLHGTVFKVYRCPHNVAGVSVIEDWWERKVGVGDMTTVNPTSVTSTGIRVSNVAGRPRDASISAQSDRPVKFSDEEPRPAAAPEQNSSDADAAQQQTLPQSRSKFHIAASLLHPNRAKEARSGLVGNGTPSSRSRLSINSQREEGRRPPSIGRRSSDNTTSPRSSTFGSVSTSRTSLSVGSNAALSRGVSVSSSSSRFTNPSARNGEPENLEPNPKDLIRAYTLQHAESGLASDYLKRKNVIRVRMEGEQFLLQAKDVAAVIEWIEGIQAATNIALDLDERPMPRGPMFPRRRRRRVRPPPENSNAPAAAAANS